MLKLLVWLGQKLFGRLPFCCLPGAVAGSLTGLFFGLWQLENPGLPLSAAEMFQAVLLLGGFSFLMILLFFGVWLRYGVLAILVPALLNSLLSAWAALALNQALQQPLFAGWLGLLAGLLVGWLLCLLCRSWAGRPRRAETKSLEELSLL